MSCPIIFRDSDLSTPGVVVERQHGRTVLWLEGEHDVDTAAELSSAIERSAGTTGDDLVLDLSGVSFMAAATIAVIGGAPRLGVVPCRSVTLRAPSRCARRIIELCGLDVAIAHGPGAGPPPGDRSCPQTRGSAPRQ